MSSTRTVATAGPAMWVAGDWNGFFGLFTNVALNVIVLTGLCLGVVKLPESIVFGRVLPALGIALPIGNLFYAWLAWQLAKREGRSDVTALPYGPSVPHMFIVIFLVMLPTYLKTNDPILAWQAGLAWAFIIGVIILLGAFVGPTMRKYTPRAAMLGALAGISIAFISMRPAALSWQVPWIAFVSLGIILVSWCARVRLPWGLPGGLAAVLVGTVLAWLGTFTGISPVMDPHAVVVALQQFGAAPADPVGRLPGRPVRYRPAAGRRRAARHLQLHRGHEQRRKRLRGGRQFRPAQGAAGRRHRRARRRGARLAVSAGGVYRPSGLEVGRRTRRLFAAPPASSSRWSASLA